MSQLISQNVSNAIVCSLVGKKLQDQKIYVGLDLPLRDIISSRDEFTSLSCRVTSPPNSVGDDIYM